MLRSLKELERYTVGATDGDIGHVVNFLLDDERWITRYLIVDTGGLFDGRLVLISPISFRQVDWSTQRFNLALTKDKIKDSPSVDVDKPVSRQHEQDYFRYYEYPNYWGDTGNWGSGAYPGLLAAGVWNEVLAEHADNPGDVHLRSAQELRGYHIQGTDDAIGHVDDFIVDDGTWEVRYLVVDTSNWWVGKKVLIAPHWATQVSWAERKVHIGMSRQAIKNCPEWNATSPINRQYEARLYDYYGRPIYWDSEDRPAISSRASHPASHPG